VYGVSRRVADSSNARCSEENKEPFLGGIFEEGFIFFRREPMILKPGELQIVSTPLEAKGGWRKQKDELVFDKTMYTPQLGDKFIVCLVTTVVTPDDYIVRWRTPLLLVEFKTMEEVVTEVLGPLDPGEKTAITEAELKAVEASPKELFPKDKPMLIVQQTSTAFRRFWVGR
jgi:hypothetical protein